MYTLSDSTQITGMESVITFFIAKFFRHAILFIRLSLWQMRTVGPLPIF